MNIRPTERREKNQLNANETIWHLLLAYEKSLCVMRASADLRPAGDHTPQQPAAHGGPQTTRGRVAPLPPPSLCRRGDFMPAVGGPAAFMDGTAPALTARRRTQKVMWPGAGVSL